MDMLKPQQVNRVTGAPHEGARFLKAHRENTGQVTSGTES